MPVTPAFFSVSEVAKAVAQSPRTVRRDIAAGRLKALKRGAGGSSRVLIPAEAVPDYIEAIVAESTLLGPTHEAA